MKESTKTVRPTRLLWSLVLGLALALVLLWSLAPRSTAEAQAVNAGFTVDLFHDRIWGKINPGESVTITIIGPGDTYGAAQTDATGFFWTPLWDGTTGTEFDIVDGDVIHFYVGDAFLVGDPPSATIIVHGVTGHVDVLNDRVTGAIPGIPAGTVVTVTLLQRFGAQSSEPAEPLPGAPRVTAATDSSGNFTATFGSVDIGPNYWATVDYAASGTVRDHLAPAGAFVAYSTYGGVYGFADPGQIVTATVNGGSPFTDTADSLHGDYWIDTGGLATGDQVEVDLSGGITISTVVANLTANVNATANLVTGTAPANASVRVVLWRWTDDEYRYYEVSTTATPGGVYTADLSSVVDLRPSDWLYVATADAEGDETLVKAGAPFISVNVTGQDVWARVDAGSVPVTATLNISTHIYTWSGTSNVQSYVAEEIKFLVGVQPGHVITVESPTWVGSMTVADVTLGFDVNNDRVPGDAPPGYAEVEVGQWEHGHYPLNGTAVQVVTLTSPFTATFADFDLRYGNWIQFRHFDGDGHETITTRNLPHIQCHGMSYVIEGNAWLSNEWVTATIYSRTGTQEGQVSGYADPSFRLEFGAYMHSVEWITVTGEAGWEAGVPFESMGTAPDVVNDRVSGYGPGGLLFTHWGSGNDWKDKFVPTDADANFLIDWGAYGADVDWGDDLRTYYTALNGNQAVSHLWWPEILAEYGPATDANRVNGYGAQPFGTAYITVTHPVSGVIGTATVTPLGDGGYTEEAQLPPGVIAPGNIITVDFGNSLVDSMIVLPISATTNVDTDVITITAPISVHIGVGFCNRFTCDSGLEGDIDASGTITFNLMTERGFDIIPGAEFDVHASPLSTTHSHITKYAFNLPVPHLRVSQQTYGDPGEGGNLAFYISYSNEGDNAAEDTVITDTMVGGMRYLTDTSPFTHTGTGGGPITFHLGALPAESLGEFIVFVEITAGVSTAITNTAQIVTSNPYDLGDPEEKVSTWSGHVQYNDTQLEVTKHAWTEDPVPGYDFVYGVNVCNFGSTGSSQVTLTDTLHPSTTLQTWWSHYPGWTEVVSDSHSLVLSCPSIPGGWGCSSVYLRVHLDGAAWPGMSLANTAIISASNDLAGANEMTYYSNVGTPHTNLSISKSWDWGQLLPGGELLYTINYVNNGNMPVTSTIYITDTLPVSTTFESAWPVPVQVTADYAVWEIDGLDNGYGGDFWVYLEVDDDAIPTTVLTNTVEISPQPDEDSYDDNVSTVAKTLYDPLPRFEVGKVYEGNCVAGTVVTYTLTVTNIGSQPGTNLVLSDTLPAGLTFGGSDGTRVGGDVTWDFATLLPYTGTATGWFSGTLSCTAGLLVDNEFYRVVSSHQGITTTDGALVSFAIVSPTISAEIIHTPGTIVVSDTVHFTATPETDGTVLSYEWDFGDGPTSGGLTITHVYTQEGDYTVVFTATDTCGYSEVATTTVAVNAPTPMAGFDYSPDPAEILAGDTVVFTDTSTTGVTGVPVVAWLWDFGDGGTSIVQHPTHKYTAVGAYTVSLLVTDSLGYTGTHAVSDAVAVGHRFHITKTWTGNGVAGTGVTYTLTATNLGSDAANVVVSDTVPAYLADVVTDSGTLDFGWIWWYLGPIAPNGGTATARFNATITCTAGLDVVNDDYGVRWSDRGVSVPAGDPVAFTVLTPTIAPTFTQSASSIVKDETVYFTGTATTDGTPLSHAWDFGDGGTAAGPNVSHTFTQTGDYTVTLTAADGCGFSDQVVRSVHVASACENVTGLTFDYGPPSPVTQSPIVFTASASGGTAPVNYVWNFGDGNTGSGRVVSHTYALSDTYTVVVTATNCGGTGVATHTKDVTVSLVEGDQITVDPTTGGTLVYTDTQNNPTTVEVPGGAVTEPVTLLYTPISSPTQPISPNLRFAGHSFDLGAYRDRVHLPGLVFSRPVTITVHYSDLDVEGIDESSLRLYYWAGAAWDDAANTCTPPSRYTHLLTQNVLSVPICHLSRFGVMGTSLKTIYLPLVVRNF